jgi:hypothetical protein
VQDAWNIDPGIIYQDVKPSVLLDCVGNHRVDGF